MISYRLVAAAAVLTASLAVVQSASADTLLATYVARISDADKQASDGFPLESAAQMVRQDRANWHKFGSGDDDDEGDDFLGSADARARFERQLKAPGAMDARTRNAIVNGYPLIQVSLYRNSVYVELID